MDEFTTLVFEAPPTAQSELSQGADIFGFCPPDDSVLTDQERESGAVRGFCVIA